MVDVHNEKMIAIEKDLENAETNSLGYGKNYHIFLR